MLTIAILALVTAALAAAVSLLDTAAHLPDPAWWTRPAIVAGISLLALAAAAALILMASALWTRTGPLRTAGHGRVRAAETAMVQRLRRMWFWLLYMVELLIWVVHCQLEPFIWVVRRRIRRRRLRNALGRHAAHSPAARLSTSSSARSS